MTPKPIVVDWKNFRCRCSAISKMMAEKQGYESLTPLQERTVLDMEAKLGNKGLTEKQHEELNRLIAKREASKKVVLSDTCIDYLMEVYSWETEGMISVSKASLETLSMEKGKKQEAQALALLGFVDGGEYKLHKKRIGNEFLTGEIDSYKGREVMAAINVTDIKNSWDYPIYLKKINKGIENGQTEQMQGYGDITGARDLDVAFCLVDTPDNIIEEMKWKVARIMGATTIESPEFLEEWKIWERSMKFEYIDPYKRVHKIKVEPFTEFEKQKVYDKVKVCRDWLYEFDEMMQNKNK